MAPTTFVLAPERLEAFCASLLFAAGVLTALNGGMARPAAQRLLELHNLITPGDELHVEGLLEPEA